MCVDVKHKNAKIKILGKLLKFYSTAFIFLSAMMLHAQSETFEAGSFIIDMGAATQTIGNGLRPYGAVYYCLRNKVPVYLVIRQGKTKDANDFIYNGRQYRGGTFIIPNQFLTPTIKSGLSGWAGQGVNFDTVTTPLTVNVSIQYRAAPRWTLDAQNGDIAEVYLNNAGINNTTFPGAYIYKPLSTLECCDDVFAIPHADPQWNAPSYHGVLWTWNKQCRGSVITGCHSGSATMNTINPSNSNQQLNFLTTRTSATTPLPYPNNSLKLWTTHAAGSPPYTNAYPDDPVAQFIGSTDAASQNGSEQIFVPKQASDLGGATRWNPGAKTIVYDPTHVDVSNPSLANGNVAATMIYGRAFDSADRGLVLIQAGHTVAGTAPANVAAQRIFLNFSFYQSLDKVPQLSVTGISNNQVLLGGATYAISVNAVTYSNDTNLNAYQWTTSFGSLSNPFAKNSNYTVPAISADTTVIISCEVTDGCGRKGFISVPVRLIPGPRPPATVPDTSIFNPLCGGEVVVRNVIANDIDPDGQPLKLTNVIGAVGGVATIDSNTGVISYINNEGFYGTEVLTYTVCDNTSPSRLCATGTYRIFVGDATNAPNAVNDNVTIAEDSLVKIDVLANDVPVVSGPLSVRKITVGPQNGKVSINLDNTITYLPNPDFAGKDSFTYLLINALEYSRIAKVVVTVIDDPCNGGTRLIAAGPSGTYVRRPTQDAYLREDQNSRNYGTCNFISIDREMSPGSRRLRGILKFDLSSLPTGATIDSAVLQMHTDQVQSNTPYTIDVHKMQTNWSEGTHCDGNGDPSWNEYSAGLAWPNNNGDFSSTVYGSTIVSTNNTTYRWTISSLVQNWYNKIDSNYGMLLKFATEGGSNELKRFVSRNAGGAAATDSPRLFVYWKLPPICGTIPMRAPMALPDTGTAINGVATAINTATNDYYPAPGGRIFTIISPPASGIATINSSSGVITYTPTGTFNGLRTLVYRVVDANSMADTAMVYIRILNAPLLAVNDTATPKLSDTIQTLDVRVNDVDREQAAITVTILEGPGNGNATVDGSGNIQYTPSLGYTGKDSLRYTACEPTPACGNAFCSNATAYFTVLNRPPTPKRDTARTNQCQPVRIKVLDNDLDPENGGFSLSIAINPLNGAATVDTVGNTITYTPNPAFSGPSDSFTYSVCDNGVPVMCSQAVVHIDINPLPTNTKPIGNDDYDSLAFNQVFYIHALANDADPDNNSLYLKLSPGIKSPSNGVVKIDSASQTIVYTPNSNYIGQDTFEYIVFDTFASLGGACPSIPSKSDTAFVILKMLAPPFNDTPIAVWDADTVIANIPKTLNVILNDRFGVDGPALGAIRIVQVPSKGTATVDSNSTPLTGDDKILYIPDSNALGTDVLVYEICDGSGDCDTAIVFILVAPPTPRPTLIPKPDTGYVWSNLGGIAIASIVANDSIGSKVSTLGLGSNSSISQNGVWPTGITLNTQTGRVTITAGTAKGRYSLSYVLCDSFIPPNCIEESIVIYVLGTKVDTIVIDFDKKSSHKVCPIDNDLVLLPGSPIYTSCGVPIGYKIDGPDTLGCYTYTKDSFFIGTEIKYSCIIICRNGLCDTTYIKLLPPNLGIIPNYISPNGDGVNDYFELPFYLLNQYPRLKFMIYNRWGSIVYRTTGGYKNDWNGTQQPEGSDLPDGVYMYLIELGDNFGKTISGFVQIMRQ